jgi:hypothetical protein
VSIVGNFAYMAWIESVTKKITFAAMIGEPQIIG